MSGKPALKILIPFIGGIVVGQYINAPLLPMVFCIIILTLSALIAFFYKRQFFGIVSIVALFGIGFVRIEWPQNTISGEDARHAAEIGKAVCLQGVIETPVDVRPTKQIFILKCDSIWIDEKGFRCCGKTRIVVYDTIRTFRQGDLILVKGKLHLPPSRLNPGDFDFRAYLAAEGVNTQLAVNHVAQIVLLARDQDGFFTRRLVRPVREFINALIDASLQDQQKALLRALLIGERGELDADVRSDLANLGVVHVLSVSGLHVGFVLIAVTIFLHTLRIPIRWRLPLLLFALFFYNSLTGSAPPVMRASIMGAIIIAAPYLQRRIDPVNTIALAAFIILMIQPLDLFAAGFQLSFAAILGIAVIYTRLKKLLAGIFSRWQEQGHLVRLSILQLLLVSFSAQIATIPIVAYYFNIFPVYSLAANLMVVPLVSVIVTIGFLAALAGVVYGPLGIIYMQCNWLLFKILLWLVEISAGLPFATLQIATPSMLTIAIYFLAVLTFIYWQQRNTAKRLLLCALTVFVVSIWYRALTIHPQLRVTFFDVGHGDAILCEFPGHRTMLIDAGDATDYIDYGERIISPYLRRQGLCHLEAMVITHGHADHLGGVPSVLQHVKVNRIIRSAATTHPAYYHAIDSLATLKNIPIQFVSAGDTLNGFNGGMILILSPKTMKMEQEEENDCSILLKVQYGARSFLFCGDLGGEGEGALQEYEKILSSDVVKVSHHGSITGNNTWFMERTKARYAIMTVGRQNRFNLPSAMVVDEWESTGAKVLRTDENGAIVFTTDGEKLQLE